MVNTSRNPQPSNASLLNPPPSNLMLTNQTPLVFKYYGPHDPNDSTVEELIWIYDYIFSQLQLAGIKIGEGSHPATTNTPTSTNPNPTKEVLTWAKCYEAGLETEYISCSDEMHYPTPESPSHLCISNKKEKKRKKVV
ncbi:hypothetical protein HanRHA438_Chr17g0816481 [Helianthus annuus]|nr:hypothetical protein HanRHA438_Chr17g0816481 [Helianthus annuus]